MKKIEFYFDISSPYSYLAHEQLKLFEKNNKFNINFMPVLLGGLHQMANITAPGLNPSRACLLYTSPSPRDSDSSRMPSSA